MSELIDERVVEMRFDNAQFEQNVNQSIKTINKLKDSLDFENAGESFENISAAAAKCDMKPLEESLDGITVKFNMLEMVAANVLGRIVNQVIDAGAKMAKSLTIDQVNAGWSKYAQKTEAVQTIMSATGASIDYVNSRLEKLIWFADETSYDFVDMVNNIGKFTSAGVDLDTAVDSMMGISNWAAASGAGIQQASRAMYNLSQAMGMGYVGLTDWRSIELANMATEEFKETVIATALDLGTLKQEANGVIKTLDGKDIVSAENMRSSLKKGWFTGDVLTTALKEYNEFSNIVYARQKQWAEENDGEYITVSRTLKVLEAEGVAMDTLGARAFQRAQEATTFNQAIAATADAVSTQWMKTFELIFGNYEQAKKLWTELSNDLWDIFAGPSESRNESLKSILDSNYKKMIDEMPDPEEMNARLSDKLYEMTKNNRGETIADYIFSQYDSLEQLLQNENYTGATLRTAFKSIADDYTKEADNAAKLSKTLKSGQLTLKQAAVRLSGGIYGKEVEQQRKVVEEMGFNYEELLEYAQMWEAGVQVDWDAAQKGMIKNLDAMEQYYRGFAEKVKKISPLDEFLQSLGEISGREKLIGGFQNIFKSVKNIYLTITAIADGISSLFGSDSFLGGLIDGFYNLTSMFAITDDAFEGMSEDIYDFFNGGIQKLWHDFWYGSDDASAGKHFDALTGDYERVSKHIPGALEKINNAYEIYIGRLPERIQNSLNTIKNKIEGFFGGVPKEVKDLFEKVFGHFEKAQILTNNGSINTLIHVGGIFEDLKTKVSNFMSSTGGTIFNGLINGLKKIADYLFGYETETGVVEGKIIGIYDKVNEFINKIKTIGKSFHEFLFGKDFKDRTLNEQLQHIPGLIDNIKTSIKTITDSDAYKSIHRFIFGEKDADGNPIKKNIFGKIGTAIKTVTDSDAYKSIYRFIFGEKDADGNPIKKNIFGKIGTAIKTVTDSEAYKSIYRFIFGGGEEQEPNIFYKIKNSVQDIFDSPAFQAIHDFIFGKKVSQTGVKNSLGKFITKEQMSQMNLLERFIAVAQNARTFLFGYDYEDINLENLEEGIEHVDGVLDPVIRKIKEIGVSVLVAINNFRKWLGLDWEITDDGLVRIPGALDKIGEAAEWVKQKFSELPGVFLDFFLGPVNKEGKRTENLFKRLPGYFETAKKSLEEFFLGKKKYTGRSWNNETKGWEDHYIREGSLIDRLKEKFDALREAHPWFDSFCKFIETQIQNISKIFSDANGSITLALENLNTYLHGGKLKHKNELGEVVEDLEETDGVITNIRKNIEKLFNGGKEKENKSFLEQVAEILGIGSNRNIFDQIRSFFTSLTSLNIFLLTANFKLGDFLGFEVQTGLEALIDSFKSIAVTIAILAGTLVGLTIFVNYIESRGYRSLIAAFGIITLLLGALAGFTILLSSKKAEIKASTAVVTFVGSVTIGLISAMMVLLTGLFLGIVGLLAKFNLVENHRKELIAAGAILSLLLTFITLITAFSVRVAKKDEKIKSASGVWFGMAAVLFGLSNFLVTVSLILGAFYLFIKNSDKVQIEQLKNAGKIVLGIIGLAVSIMAVISILTALASSGKNANKTTFAILTLMMISINGLIFTIVAVLAGLYYLMKNKSLSDLKTPIFILVGILTSIGLLIGVLLLAVKNLGLSAKSTDKSKEEAQKIDKSVFAFLAVLLLMLERLKVVISVLAGVGAISGYENLAVAFSGIALLLLTLSGVTLILSKVKGFDKSIISTIGVIFLIIGSVGGLIALFAEMSSSGAISNIHAVVMPFCIAITEVMVLIASVAGLILFLKTIKINEFGKDIREILLNIGTALLAIALTTAIIGEAAAGCGPNIYKDIVPLLLAMSEIAVFASAMVLLLKLISSSKIDGSQVKTLAQTALLIIEFAAIAGLLVYGVRKLKKGFDPLFKEGTFALDFQDAWKKLLPLFEVIGEMILIMTPLALIMGLMEHFNVKGSSVASLAFLAPVLIELAGAAVVLTKIADSNNFGDISTAWKKILPLLEIIGEMAAAMTLLTLPLALLGACKVNAHTPFIFLEWGMIIVALMAVLMFIINNADLTKIKDLQISKDLLIKFGIALAGIAAAMTLMTVPLLIIQKIDPEWDAVWKLGVIAAFVAALAAVTVGILSLTSYIPNPVDFNSLLILLAGLVGIILAISAAAFIFGGISKAIQKWPSLNFDWKIIGGIIVKTLLMITEIILGFALVGELLLTIDTVIKKNKLGFGIVDSINYFVEMLTRIGSGFVAIIGSLAGAIIICGLISAAANNFPSVKNLDLTVVGSIIFKSGLLLAEMFGIFIGLAMALQGIKWATSKLFGDSWLEESVDYFADFMDKFSGVIFRFGVAIGIMTIALTFLSKIKMPSGGGDNFLKIAAFIGKASLVLMEIILAIVGIGQVLSWIEKGGEKLGLESGWIDKAVDTIATIITKILGGIGSCIRSLVDNLRGDGEDKAEEAVDIGTKLGSFMTSLKPFLEAIQSLTLSDLTQVGLLSGIMSGIFTSEFFQSAAEWVSQWDTGAEITTVLGDISSLFGENGPMSVFLSSIDELTGKDIANVNMLSSIMHSLFTSTFYQKASEWVSTWTTGTTFTAVLSDLGSLFDETAPLPAFLKKLEKLPGNSVENIKNLSTIMFNICTSELFKQAASWVSTWKPGTKFTAVLTDLDSLFDETAPLPTFLQKLEKLPGNSVDNIKNLSTIMFNICTSELFKQAASWVSTWKTGTTFDDVLTDLGSLFGENTGSLTVFLGKLDGLKPEDASKVSILTSVMANLCGSVFFEKASTWIESWKTGIDFTEVLTNLGTLFGEGASLTTFLSNIENIKETDKNHVETLSSVLESIFESTFYTKASEWIQGWTTDGNFTTVISSLGSLVGNDGPLTKFLGGIEGLDNDDVLQAGYISKILSNVFTSQLLTGGVKLTQWLTGSTNYVKLFGKLTEENGVIDGVVTLSGKLTEISGKGVDYSLVAEASDAIASVFNIMKAMANVTSVKENENLLDKLLFWKDTATWDSVKISLQNLQTRFLDQIVEFQNALITAGIDSTYIENTVGTYFTMIDTVMSLAASGNKEIDISNFIEIGNYIVEGLVLALTSEDSTSAVYKAAYDLGLQLLAGLREGTDEHSPSKAAFQVGQFITEGLMNGLRAGEPLTWDMARQFGEGTIEALMEGAKKYDSYGLTKHAINMVTSDLVDENIFNMPDFTEIDRFGNEVQNFEKMEDYLKEKFGGTFDNSYIEGFIGSMKKAASEVPQVINDADYANMMVNIAEGDFGFGQDAIIDSLTKELGDVNAATQAWQDYTDVLAGNIEINKDLLKQRKQNPPMTEEQWMAMYAWDKEGFDKANRGEFHDLAAANGTTWQEEAAKRGYDPKRIQAGFNAQWWNSESYYELYIKNLAELELAQESAKNIGEQSALSVVGAAQEVTEAVESTTEAIAENAETVKDIPNNYQDATIELEKQAEMHREVAKAAEESAEAAVAAGEETTEAFDYESWEKVVKKASSGVYNLTEAEQKLLMLGQQETITKGTFGNGIVVRANNMQKLAKGLSDEEAKWAANFSSSFNASEQTLEEYIKTHNTLYSAAESASSASSDASNAMVENFSDAYDQLDDKSQNFFTKLSERLVEGVKNGTKNLDITDLLKDIGYTKNTKQLIKLDDIFGSDSGLSLEDKINYLSDPKRLAGSVLSNIGSVDDFTGNLTEVIKSKDILKEVIDIFTDPKGAKAGFLNKVGDVILETFGLANKEADELSEKEIAPKVDDSGLASFNAYLDEIYKKYELLDNGRIAKEGSVNLQNGQKVTSKQAAELQKVWDMAMMGAYGNSFKDISDKLAELGIDYASLFQLSSGGKIDWSQYTDDVSEYADEVKALGDDYSVKQLMEDSNAGKFGENAIERKKAYEKAGLDAEKAEALFQNYLKNGSKVLDEAELDYYKLSDAELEAKKKAEEYNEVLNTTPQGAFRAISDFLEGVTKVIDDDKSADKFRAFIDGITGPLQDFNVDKASEFEKIAGFLNAVRTSARESTAIAKDFAAFVDGIDSSIEKLGQINIENPEAMDSVKEFLNGIKIENKETLDTVAAFIQSIVSFAEGSAAGGDYATQLSATITTMVNEINALPDIDTKKTEPLTNFFEKLTTELGLLRKDDSNTVRAFLTSFYAAFESSENQAQTAAGTIANAVISKFRFYYNTLKAIGRRFTEEFAKGIESNQSRATQAGQTIAGAVMASLREGSVQKASDTGTEFVSNLVTSLESEESKQRIKDALGNLFEQTPEEKSEKETPHNYKDGSLIEPEEKETENTENTETSELTTGGAQQGLKYGQEFLSGLSSAIQNGSGTISGSLTSMFAGVTAGADAFSSIAETAQTSLNSLATTLTDVLANEEEGGLVSAVDNLKGLLNGIFPDGKGKADAMIEGMIEGLAEGSKYVSHAMRLLSKGIVFTVDQVMQINSPSKVMRQRGLYIMEGWAEGLHAGSRDVYREMNNTAEGSLSTLSSAIKTALDTAEDSISTDPVIRPVVDLSEVYSAASAIDNELSTDKALDISTAEKSKFVQNGSDPQQTAGTQIFNQYNYSPKPLSRADIYRQTKNQFAMLKGVNQAAV